MSEAAKPSKVALVQRALANYEPLYATVLGDPAAATALRKLGLVAVGKVPGLRDCTPSSIALAVLRAAQLGLDIGTTCHILPYQGAAQLVVDYRGYVELMVAAGGVARVEARCVYQDEIDAGDFMVEYGTGPRIVHRPHYTPRLNTKANEYEPAALAYCVAYWPDRGYKFEIMTFEEIEAARDGKGGPWRNWRPEMEKKTVLRRLAKTIPQSPRLRAAFENENRVEGWKASPDPVLDVRPVEVAVEVVSESAE